MGIISSGFHGRRQTGNPALPPGQYETGSFPVLTAGPAPYIPTEDWEFFITAEDGRRHAWSWDAFMALPQVEIRTDIHCVTSWSKLGTSWRGVSLDTLFEDVETSCEFSTAHSYGGYTTNVPIPDLLYRGVDIPVRFFSVAAFIHEGELAATGYVVGQSPQLAELPDCATARRH
jgi:DMSO/TMAO reductase YedYZ molybdopterin-dependent catalytic subunit